MLLTSLDDHLQKECYPHEAQWRGLKLEKMLARLSFFIVTTFLHLDSTVLDLLIFVELEVDDDIPYGNGNMANPDECLGWNVIFHEPPSCQRTIESTRRQWGEISVIETKPMTKTSNVPNGSNKP